MRRGALLSLALALGVLATSAEAESLTSVAGTYEITSTEDGGCSGTLSIDAEGVVRRRVLRKNKTLHASNGKATLAGTTLTVAFEGPGDPRDLGGNWIVVIEQGGTKLWKGHARFHSYEGSWSANWSCLGRGNGVESGSADMAGVLDGNTLRAARSGTPADSTADAQTVTYTLGADGLSLTGSLGAGYTETLTREHLPPGPNGITVAYEVAGGSIKGTFPAGATDEGKRRVATVEKKPPAEVLAQGKVANDPVPVRLRAHRDTHVTPFDKNGPAAGLDVKAGTALQVVGYDSKAKLWYVKLDRWKGSVPEKDLEFYTSFAKVDAPIFLPGKLPKPTDMVQGGVGDCYFDAALMAIARVSPQTIEDMFHDHKDGTVSVRFHEKTEDGRFAQKWVRIKTTVFVGPDGRSRYAMGSEGQLWPALAEKAWAVFHGNGFYGRIEGGWSGTVFEAVLGRRSHFVSTFLALPVELNDLQLRELVPGLSAADRQAIASHRRSKAWADEKAALKVMGDGWRRESLYVDQHLAKLVAAGVSETGKNLLQGAWAKRLDGPLGSGRYTQETLDVSNGWFTAIKEKRAVALGTWCWGQMGDTKMVAGLVSGHAYMGADVFQDRDEPHLRWIKIANPWHTFGRLYERKAGGLQPVADKNPKDAGISVLELSDLMKHYEAIAWVERN